MPLSQLTGISLYFLAGFPVFLVMPQMTNNIIGWTLGELVEETRGKLRLKGTVCTSVGILFFFSNKSCLQNARLLKLYIWDRGENVSNFFSRTAYVMTSVNMTNDNN